MENNRNIYILLDADNIQFEVFINDIKPQIEYKYGKPIQIYLYCQTNLTFKYESMRKLTLSILCSRTRNKNSTDAQIIFHTGKIIGESSDNMVIIVSNDQIFNEISGDSVVIIGNNQNMKKLKLNKNNILNVFTDLSKDCKFNKSKDIYIDEFLPYFSKYSITNLEDSINQIPELCISKTNCVYWRR